MKVLVAGDYVPQGKTAQYISKGEYDQIFGELLPLTSDMDYSIVNLEAPVIFGEPTPITKSGPNLYCSEMALDAIIYAGFDCVTLANNHFFDQSEKGVRTTIECCIRKSLDYVGGGNDIDEASRILYKTIGGANLAVINCCEKEFSIADDRHGGSNPLEPIRIYYAIKEARKNADYILLITHGGIEYYQYPYPQMQELYRFFIDAGADAVVNHHQHCISGYEVYQGKPIFYGIGNFCFEKTISSVMWKSGYMIELNFNSGTVSFKTHPYIQSSLPDIGVRLCNNESASTSFQLIDRISEMISDPRKLHFEFERYIDSINANKLLNLEPIYNPYIRFFQKKNLLPRLVKKNAMVDYFVRMSCVSHNIVNTKVIKRKLGL